MTAHDHTAITPGCYRCDLNLDEIPTPAETMHDAANELRHLAHAADAATKANEKYLDHEAPTNWLYEVSTLAYGNESPLAPDVEALIAATGPDFLRALADLMEHLAEGEDWLERELGPGLPMPPRPDDYAPLALARRILGETS